MHSARIEAALTIASKHLEDATQALSNNNEEAMLDPLWSASSETEYALFFLHLAQGDKLEVTRRPSSMAKVTREVASVLASAQQSLQSAKANAHAGNFTKSYEDAGAAQSLLQKAQELLAKKRRDRVEK